MNITANTPRPKPTKNQRPGCITWIFLLLILLGPGRGILAALFQIVAPRVSGGLLWSIIGGIVVVGALVAVISRAATNRTTDTRLPTGPGAATDRRQRGGAPAPLPGPAQLPGGTQSGPPRFEPIITGKVVVAGFVLAACFAAAFLLLATSLSIRP